MKPLRILLFLLLLCRSSTLGDDDDGDDDDDGGEPLKKMSLKDYRVLVAPNNDDYFYATKYRTDCDLFHCINPSSGRYCLDDMSSCAFTEAEEAGSEYDSGLTSLQNTERNFGNDGVFNISRRRRVQVTYISLPCLSRQNEMQQTNMDLEDQYAFGEDPGLLENLEIGDDDTQEDDPCNFTAETPGEAALGDEAAAEANFLIRDEDGDGDE